MNAARSKEQTPVTLQRPLWILRNLRDWINRKQYLLGQFFPHDFSHLLILARGIVTAEQMWPVRSALPTMLCLALTAVVRGECLQKQAVLLLTARMAWKLLAGRQTAFCGFFRSDLGCCRSPGHPQWLRVAVAKATSWAGPALGLHSPWGEAAPGQSRPALPHSRDTTNVMAWAWEQGELDIRK